MSRLLELRDFLRGDQPVLGRVVAVSDGVVQVATLSGVVEVVGNINLKTGDAVTIQSGRAIKKRLDSPGSVYLV